MFNEKDIQDIKQIVPNFNVTTMTLSIKIENLDISSFCDVYNEKNSKNDNNKETKSFYNAHNLSLAIDNQKSVNLKIFKSVITVTGIKNQKHIDFVLDILKSFNVNTTSINLVMINCNMKLDKILNLDDMKTTLCNHPKFTSINYQPTRYHGLRTTHENGTKFILFKSGSICVISKDTSILLEAIDDLIF